MSVASNIVTLRERQGLNQKELAESLNMNRSVLNRIENGTRPVRDDELKIIADYFNVSADYLLGRETPKAPALSDEQTIVLKGFNSLNLAGRNLLVGVLDSLRVSHAAAVLFGGLFMFEDILRAAKKANSENLNKPPAYSMVKMPKYDAPTSRHEKK